MIISTARTRYVSMNLCIFQYIDNKKPASLFLFVSAATRHACRPKILECTCSSDSGRLMVLKETARSQEWFVLRTTNAHHHLIFVQLKFVWENLKTQVTFSSMEFATTDGDRSTELTESFLLVYRYLDFDNASACSF